MKYRVYSIAHASQEIGVYEANSPEDAARMADGDKCTGDVEVGDRQGMVVRRLKTALTLVKG